MVTFTFKNLSNQVSTDRVFSSYLILMYLFLSKNFMKKAFDPSVESCPSRRNGVGYQIVSRPISTKTSNSWCNSVTTLPMQRLPRRTSPSPSHFPIKTQLIWPTRSRKDCTSNQTFTSTGRFFITRWKGALWSCWLFHRKNIWCLMTTNPSQLTVKVCFHRQLKTQARAPVASAGRSLSSFWLQESILVKLRAAMSSTDFSRF